MKVVIAAGGTGGHLFPGMAVAEELRAQGHTVHFIVKKDASSQETLAQKGFVSSAFYFEGFPRRFGTRLLLFPFTILGAMANAHRILKRVQPDRVLGMGGYITVPVGLAAFGRKIPVVIHEQNVVAGLANRLLSRWAARAAVSFENTGGLRCPMTLTGLPLRPGVTPEEPRAARQFFGLDPDRLTLLIFGGSQGARAINRVLGETLPLWKTSGRTPQFIHVTGRDAPGPIQKAYADNNLAAWVAPFCQTMGTAYGAADVVIGRAGANTVFELERSGRRALLVPFPHATDDHQTRNAEWAAAQGWAEVWPEPALTATRLVEWVVALDLDSLRRDNSARLEKRSALPHDAAARVVNILNGGIL